MALNPSIILAGQQADIMGSFDRGQQAGERQSQIREQNALRNLYQTQGAGLVAGEQGALNALAGINAPLAMDFRRTQQTLQIDQENARLRAAELARSLSADQRAQASEQFGMGAQMIAMAQTPEQFQAIISRPGFADAARVLGITPDMLTFENRDTLAAAALGAADVMKLRAGPEQTAGMQEYEFARSQGYTGTFADWKASSRANTNVTVNTGVAGPGADEEALRKKLGEGEGTQWAGYLAQGAQAAGMSQDMEMLNEIIQLAPQGPLEGRLANAFPGMNSAADAFNSIVKRVAPTMRAEGSGSTSDIEYEGMLRSLPQLSNRPEANMAVAAMIQAKAQINMERAQIVSQYQNGALSLTDARNRLNELNSRSIMTPELRALITGLSPAPASPANDYSGMTDDEIRKELGL